MTIPRLRRTLLAIPLAAVLLTTFTPSMASAAEPTAQFNLSVSSGRPGIPIDFSHDDPCPAIPEGVEYQEVQFSFTDANGIGTTHTISNGATNPDGTWSYGGGMYIPYRWAASDVNPPVLHPEAAVGTALIRAKCVLPDGTVSQEYAPEPFNVTGPSYAFAASTATVQPGANITVNSVDACVGDRVTMTIMDTQVAHNIDVTPDASGAWSVTFPASYQEMDGTMTPYPPGPGLLRAYCQSNTTGGIFYGYADLLLTIGGTTPPAYNCKDLALFAVTGSGEHFDGTTNLDVSPTLRTVREGFMSVLTAGKKPKLRVINYPAHPVTTLTEEHNPPKYLEGKNVGVNRLLSAIEEYRTNCAGKPIAIMGYSQGALVAREAMVKYAATHSGADRQAITTIIEIANPARLSDSPVVDFGTADKASYGLCKYLAGGGCFKDTPLVVKEMPQVYQGRTWAVCKQYDVVCDTSTDAAMMWPFPPFVFPEAQLAHTTYNGDTEVKLAGKRAARQVNNKF